MRRLQDLAGAGRQNIILIFLDWEKAFDRISHQRLFEALERMKIDTKMINNIRALYEHPFFKTIHNTEESEWKKTAFWHTTGMSATALFLNFNDERPIFRCEAQEQWCFFSRKTVNNMTFQELLYADDTLVIAKNTQSAKDYLRYIEEESEYYNIKLNRNKCVCITYNRNNQITFADGQKFKSVDETINLGTQINKRVNPKIEINRRISSTMPILKS